MLVRAAATAERIRSRQGENCLKKYLEVIYTLHSGMEEYLEEEQLTRSKDVLDKYLKNEDVN